MSYIQIQCDDCQGVNQMNANDIPLGPVAGGYSGALVGEIAYRWQRAALPVWWMY